MSKIGFMREALIQAQKAAEMGEVPIGAVIVHDGKVIARAHNLTETGSDPTAHAEILAIRQASEKLGEWKLQGCTLFVTCEPCAMCAGAMVWSRIDKVVIGTMDPKAGACGSLYSIPEDERLNHRVSVETGILAEECSRLLKDFFADLRKQERRTEE